MSNKNNSKLRQRKPLHKSTKYDIPTFSYKSGLLIGGASLITVIVIILIGELFSIDIKLLSVLGLSIVMGFTVAYSQYKIETKRGFVAGFYKLFALITITLMIVLSFVPF